MLVTYLSFQKKKQQILLFRNLRNDQIRQIDLKQVMFFSTDQNYVNMYLEGGERGYFLKTISSLEQRLAKDNFERVHRSYLVNFNFILSINLQLRNVPINKNSHSGSGGIIRLLDTETNTIKIIPIGRNYRSALRRFIK